MSPRGPGSCAGGGDSAMYTKRSMNAASPSSRTIVACQRGGRAEPSSSPTLNARSDGLGSDVGGSGGPSSAGSTRPIGTVTLANAQGLAPHPLTYDGRTRRRPAGRIAARQLADDDRQLRPSRGQRGGRPGDELRRGDLDDPSPEPRRLRRRVA